MDAVKMVTVEENGRKEIDIKRYARVEKVPGGSIEDSHVLRGVMLNKDVVHPKMRRCVRVSACARAHCSSGWLSLLQPLCLQEDREPSDCSP